ncbi:MAG: hypothetical protein Q8M39_08440 [Sulfuricurvum sp.]|nr:hypothetical protein [Sulfuricurvum sp.]
MDNQETTNNIDSVLTSLWIIGFIVALILIFTISKNGLTDSASLIGAFTILISAGIASASVMKSIYTIRINDQEKAAKEKERKRIFSLNVMKTIQVTLGTFSRKAESHYKSAIGLRDFRTPTDFDSDIQTTGKLLSSVFCESILPYLTDEEQEIISNFYSEYYRFLATYEDNTMKQSYVVSAGQIPTKKSQKPLHQQIQIFSDFAQSYIDLNTKEKV